MQIAQKFVLGVAFGRATRNRRHLGPETAFLRFVHYDLNPHSHPDKERQNYPTISAFLKQRAISFFAVSGPSEPCTEFF